MASSPKQSHSPDRSQSPLLNQAVPSALNYEEDVNDIHQATPQADATSQQDSPDSNSTSQNEDVGKDVDTSNAHPPLPEEPLPPPLPDEPLPAAKPTEDDGWAPVWDAGAQSYYFYNRFTNASQWENPRIPEASTTTTPHSNHDRIAAIEHAPGTTPYQQPPAPGTTSYQHAPGTTPYLAATTTNLHPAVVGGYNPAIHGDYDPNADYAQAPPSPTAATGLPYDPTNPTGHLTGDEYAATATFNRFTGRFQAPSLTSDNYNDEAKSKRQMNAFFDVDSASNGHDGRSLRAERAGQKLSKSEVKAFKEKRRERKEEKRRAWLRD